MESDRWSPMPIELEHPGVAWRAADPNSKGKPGITFLLTTLGYPRLQAIRRFLESLANQTCFDFEVLVADQGDIPLESLLQIEDFNFVVKIISSRGGASAGRNQLADVSNPNLKYVAIPNDTTRYGPTFVETVVANSDSDAQIFEIFEDGTPRYSFRESRDPFSKANVFKVLEPMAIIRRDYFLLLGGLDENLGTGASSPWQNAGLADLLLRGRETFENVVWIPGSGYLSGSSQDAGLSRREICEKAFRYGRGYMFVRSRWGYSYLSNTLSLCASLVRPKAGYPLSKRIYEFAGRCIGLAKYITSRGLWEPSLRYSVVCESENFKKGSELTFVIVTKGPERLPELRLLFESLRIQERPNFSVLLVAQSFQETYLKELLRELESFSHKLVISPRGLSRGRNIGIRELPDGTRYVAFPNDTTTYHGSFSATVFGTSSESHVIGFELWDGAKPRYSLSSLPAELGVTNVWRLIEPAVVISKKTLLELGGFPLGIGAGSTTPWGSGELSELLARRRMSPTPVNWQPDTRVVFGVPQTYNLTRSQIALKYFQYGRGYLFVRCVIGSNKASILGSVASPFFSTKNGYSIYDRAFEFAGRLMGIFDALTFGRSYLKALREKHA